LKEVEPMERTGERHDAADLREHLERVLLDRRKDQARIEALAEMCERLAGENRMLKVAISQVA